MDRYFELSDIQMEGADPIVKDTRFDANTGTITIPGRTVAVLYER
ncbi:alpha-1,6-glucosidase domain-containing protein [Actinomyces ruminis]|nr:alpha-1,6-glucosidase domain-containing protein [Actinomyces ruminis]